MPHAPQMIFTKKIANVFVLAVAPLGIAMTAPASANDDDVVGTRYVQTMLGYPGAAYGLGYGIYPDAWRYRANSAHIKTVCGKRFSFDGEACVSKRFQR